MAPVLYIVPASPFVRSVQMTAQALGLDLELKEVDLMKGENRTPEYLKMNPQHTVPVLVDDDGFTIWDSHAINPYLVSKYGKDDSLYPKDVQQRAVINQRLHFDSDSSSIGRQIMYGFFAGKKGIDQADKDKINQIYAFLEAFLDGKEWLAGDSLTIADYSSYTSLTSLNVLVPFDGSKYPKLEAWFKKVAGLPEAGVNVKGVALLEATLKGMGVI